MLGAVADAEAHLDDALLAGVSVFRKRIRPGRLRRVGTQRANRLAPLGPHELAYDEPRCASLDGFTLHAATRAGAFHPAGREALLRYVLRPPIAQERLEPRPDGLVRITLNKAYTDGTFAVLAVIKEPASIARTLAAVGEASEVPRRSPGRGPP